MFDFRLWVRETTNCKRFRTIRMSKVGENVTEADVGRWIEQNKTNSNVSSPCSFSGCFCCCVCFDDCYWFCSFLYIKFDLITGCFDYIYICQPPRRNVNHRSHRTVRHFVCACIHTVFCLFCYTLRKRVREIERDVLFGINQVCERGLWPCLSRKYLSVVFKRERGELYNCSFTLV